MPHDHYDDRESRTRHHRARDSRSRSPYRRNTDRKRTRTPSREREVKLPFGARKLSKHDDRQLWSLFGLYLDVQKQLDLDELDEKEAMGRWKSFVNKWNRGDLAEGWYDPETFAKAERSAQESSGHPAPPQPQRQSPSPPAPTLARNKTPHESRNDAEDDEDDDYGPALPNTALLPTSTSRPAGATIPTAQDLALRDESLHSDRASALAAHRHARASHRKLAAQRLDELAPKAEPGTRERQLEKKREAAASNRAFAASKTEGDGQAEVGDGELMGGEDGVEEYRRMKREGERKRSEREVRREEVLRAQRAERDERMRVYREKEQRTMAGLVELARQRFG